MKYNYRSLALMVMSMLGFSSACDKVGDEPEMYGCPFAHYDVSGEVSDGEGNPVEGIRVAVEWNDANGVEECSLKDTVYTDSNGAFKSRISGFPIQPEILDVVFEDVDGEENGSFEESSVEVTEIRHDEGDGTIMFSNGTYSAEVNVSLKNKE